MDALSSASNQVSSVIPKPRSHDGEADLGLQDRNTSQERVAAIRAEQQRVQENHGFLAKEVIKDALTNNTKIVNSAPQRGSLIDLAA